MKNISAILSFIFVLGIVAPPVMAADDFGNRFGSRNPAALSSTQGADAEDIFENNTDADMAALLNEMNPAAGGGDYVSDEMANQPSLPQSLQIISVRPGRDGQGAPADSSTAQAKENPPHRVKRVYPY